MGLQSNKKSFADALKTEVADLRGTPFFFNIDPWTDDQEEKKRIRPLLVWWGMERRKQDPIYWIKKVEQYIYQIQRNANGTRIVFIPDVRFSNEVDFVHVWKGKVVHITRKDSNLKPYPAPNEEEKTNDPIVKAKADSLISWMDSNSLDPINDDYLNGIVQSQILDFSNFLKS